MEDKGISFRERQVIDNESRNKVSLVGFFSFFSFFKLFFPLLGDQEGSED